MSGQLFRQTVPITFLKLESNGIDKNITIEDGPNTSSFDPTNDNASVNEVPTQSTVNRNEKNFVYQVLKTFSPYRGALMIDAYEEDKKMYKKMKEKNIYIEYKEKFIRKDVAQILIEHEIYVTQSYYIPDSRFKELQQSITELFPEEVATCWYSGSYRDLQGPKSAGGLLYSVYKRLRSEAEGVGRKLTRRTKRKFNQTLDSYGEEDIDEIGFIDSIDDEFKKKWCETFEERRKVYSSSTIPQIFEKFPAFSLASGHRLFLKDFAMEYRDKVDKLTKSWPDVSKRIYALAQMKKSQKHFSTIWDKYANDTVNPNEQYLALILFPALLFMYGSGKKKIGDWRPSVQEYVNSFVYHVENPADVKSKQKNLKDLLDIHNQPLEPYVLISGPINNPTVSYAVINEHNYVTSSPVEALDVCFKTIKVLGKKFGDVACHSWEFVDKIIYEFPCKSASKSVSTMETDLKRLS